VFIGSREDTAHLGYAIGVCPQCKQEGAFSVYSAKRNLTLYVVAKFPMGQQMVLECNACHVRFAIPKSDEPEMTKRLISAEKLSEIMMQNHRAVQNSPAARGPVGPTLYQLLQLDPSADPDVIDAAYKRIALKYHPDRDKSPEAVERMQLINEAKRILSDPALRERYDRSIGIVRQPPPPKRGVAIRPDEV
jgi:hypothetical protein